MPFSHSCGGLKPPLHPSGRLTLNRFTMNGFIPPVDALRHGRSRKPSTICSYEKRARNSPGICSYKTEDLNFPGINSYKKTGGGPLLASLLAMPLSACLLSTTRFTNGGAGLYLVFAKTDLDAGARGVTAFLVEPAFPGFRVSRYEDKMSLRTSRSRRSTGDA